MIKKILVVLAIILTILFIKRIFKKDTWRGFYYPDENNLFNYTVSPLFSSAKECRNWVDKQIRKYNPSGYGYNYECGKNCKARESSTLSICEETIR
ncbi:hypothetical protein GF360_03185 [candidate division WWE3 bacterium]|nr:hypothetical protein [candidate division WWE3 bacterium]